MINLLLGDCMDLMRSKPDKYYDLAIVDPPYGIGIDGQKETINKKRNPKQNRKLHKIKGWDSTTPDKYYFKELFRVSKNQIIWGANYFVSFLNESHKGWIIWDKMQYWLTMSDCEIAYSSFDISTRIWQKNRGILMTQGGTIHPTEKPIDLYKWLLTNYAKQGQKILDTHGGSFSHAIAAYDLGFDLDIIELDEDYFKAGKERFDTHVLKCEEIKHLGFAKTELSKNNPTLF